MSASAPSLAQIGFFDSGVGGLSVLRAFRQQFPAQAAVYFADQGHVPYGPRRLEEVRCFAREITRFLMARGARIVVVACNTASAAALHTLRQEFPAVSFVGMEPAVKPAAESTQTGKVGVLATPATFQGELYASVVERFGGNVTLLQHTCPGLVQLIEKGQLNTPETRAVLVEALTPMLDQGIDAVVLGCTHYPFVIPLIQEIVGPGVRVIDPAPAVARQAGRILTKNKLLESGTQTGVFRFFSSGEAQNLRTLLPRLLGEDGEVVKVEWQGANIFTPGAL